MPKTREELNRRRKEILNILGSGIRVESLDELGDQLKVRGFQVTKSSISRDLKDLEIVRVDGHFQIPASDPEDKALQRMDDFIREVVPSGPYLTVILCTPGAGRGVATVLKSQEWMEITGVVSDNETAVVSTANNYDQKLLLSRLKRHFGPKLRVGSKGRKAAQSLQPEETPST
jgi:transcriptional regulator of arginine metabolism